MLERVHCSLSRCLYASIKVSWGLVITACSQTCSVRVRPIKDLEQQPRSAGELGIVRHGDSMGLHAAGHACGLL